MPVCGGNATATRTVGSARKSRPDVAAQAAVSRADRGVGSPSPARPGPERRPGRGGISPGRRDGRNKTPKPAKPSRKSTRYRARLVPPRWTNGHASAPRPGRQTSRRLLSLGRSGCCPPRIVPRVPRARPQSSDRVSRRPGRVPRARPRALAADRGAGRRLLAVERRAIRGRTLWVLAVLVLPSTRHGYATHRAAVQCRVAARVGHLGLLCCCSRASWLPAHRYRMEVTWSETPRLRFGSGCAVRGSRVRASAPHCLTGLARAWHCRLSP